MFQQIAHYFFGNEGGWKDRKEKENESDEFRN